MLVRIRHYTPRNSLSNQLAIEVPPRFQSQVALESGHNLPGFSTSGRPVEHKVHRPDLIGSQRMSQWVTLCHGNFLALSPANLQTCLGIEPIQLVMKHHIAALPQLQIDHVGTVASVLLHEHDDLRVQDGIAVDGGLVAEYTGAHANQRSYRRSRSPLPCRWCTSSSRDGALTTFFAGPLWHLWQSRYNFSMGMPASASRKKPMICSSVNRFFMSNLHARLIGLSSDVLLNTGATSRAY